MNTSSSKRPISIRVDQSVLDWFKAQEGKRYQTLMNSILRKHVEAERNKLAHKLGRAQELFRRFYAQCFWHYDPQVAVTGDNLSLVIEGLRKHGGREGLLIAEELCR